MHDLVYIRENPEEFDRKIAQRNLEPLSKKILTLDQEIRDYKSRIQFLNSSRNDLSKKIGVAKRNNDHNLEGLFIESEKIKSDIASLGSIDDTEKELHNILSSVPNILDLSVPYGVDEDDNQEIKLWGKIPNFAFTVKEHNVLGENLRMLDFTLASQISGARFSFLFADLARLERAIANFMLDIHTAEYDYLEVAPPVLVKDEAMFGVGQLPKFAEDSFVVDDKYRLTPTAEVTLTNIVRDKILSKEKLPLRYVAYTNCFRSEAGSAGRDTVGLIRMHQFSKVELVSITSEEDSNDELERKLSAAVSILQKLKLPYRVMLLCSGDIGFSAQKTYDIEVWLPGQNKYREISSCSNCGSFQARRMKARYRHHDKKTYYAHTLNGSGLAVGRTMVAILENYQQENGSIKIPEVLVPYMGGKEIIEKHYE